MDKDLEIAYIELKKSKQKALKTKPSTNGLLGIIDVMLLTGMSRATVCRAVNGTKPYDGTFPKPKKIGVRSFWNATEINDWLHKDYPAEIQRAINLLTKHGYTVLTPNKINPVA